VVLWRSHLQVLDLPCCWSHRLWRPTTDVHAIVLCNAAELVGGTMTDVSVPAGARWIPKGMTVAYLAKAKTDLTAVADGSGIDWTTAGDKIVPIEVFDTDGKKVFSAEITMNVKLAA